MKYFLVDNETGKVWDKSYLITSLESGLDTVKRVNAGMGYDCFRLEVGEKPTGSTVKLGKYKVIDVFELTEVDTVQVDTLFEGKLVLDMLNRGSNRYVLVRR